VSLLSTALGDGSIILGATAGNWEEAVRLAGHGLVASGRTTEQYTHDMVAAVHQLGPYMVIGPGLAMPHTRPSESVLETGMSLVVLQQAVEFGHQRNDPVHVLFGLAALDHDRHLELLSEFASLASDPDFVKSLLSCSSTSEIRELIN
jgi:PTS system ascorbate-specific IIA component